VLPVLPVPEGHFFMTKTVKAVSLSIAGVALLLAAPALAAPKTTTAAAATAGAATTVTGKPDPTVAPAATGSINLEPTFDQRMADCMAIWDKGTHMNKDEWRRTCKTTLSGP
jgi:hypothetical protein